MVTAMFATQMGSLIEAVNILGSLFYGVILGIFLVALYMKKVGANAVFYGAVISEVITIVLFTMNAAGAIQLGFLWLTMISIFCVMVISWVLQATSITRP